MNNMSKGIKVESEDEKDDGIKIKDKPVQMKDEEDRLDEGAYKQLHMRMVESISDYLFDKFEIFYSHILNEEDKNLVPVTPQMFKSFFKRLNVDVNDPDYKKSFNNLFKKVKEIHEKHDGTVKGGKYIFPNNFTFFKKRNYKKSINKLISSFFDHFSSKAIYDIEFVKGNDILKGAELSNYEQYVAKEQDIQGKAEKEKSKKSSEKSSTKDDKETKDSKSSKSSIATNFNKSPKEMAQDKVDKFVSWVDNTAKKKKQEIDDKFYKKMTDSPTKDYGKKGK